MSSLQKRKESDCASNNFRLCQHRKNFDRHSGSRGLSREEISVTMSVAKESTNCHCTNLSKILCFTFILVSILSQIVCTRLLSHNFNHDRQNRPRFVYTHFKSRDQPLDKSSFDFSNIFQAMQSCAMCAKSRSILKLPKSMVT